MARTRPIAATINFILIVLSAIAGNSAMAADCEKDKIQAVFLDDSSFTMASGAKYQVDWAEYKVEYADESDIKLWMAFDEVLICGNLMINTNAYSQTAPVKRK